MILNLSSDIQK